MKKVLFSFLCLIGLTACQVQVQATTLPPTAAPDSKGMKLSSPGFDYGKKIPDQYACQNGQAGKSPELLIEHVPAQAVSLAVMVEDIDAPMGIFYHWVIYNIPPALTDVPEGMPVRPHVVGIGTQGTNSFAALGYGGPCPPFAQTHRYYFHLYATDLALNLTDGMDANQLKARLQGHILAQADWMGTYK